MKIPLSRRLARCADYIHPGERIADVGCDHGYLGIYLLREGLAESVIASDIHEGPLESARANARKFGVSDKMEFCLSDGASQIPRDFDTMVCAGMGSLTMISILEAAPWLRDPRYRLILQCQTKTPLLRRYLSDNGWQISRESILRDGKFLYTVLEAVYSPGIPLTAGQCHLSPALMAENQPELGEYYGRIVNGLVQAVTGHGAENVPFKAEALRELSQDPLYEPFQEEQK